MGSTSTKLVYGQCNKHFETTYEKYGAKKVMMTSMQAISLDPLEFCNADKRQHLSVYACKRRGQSAPSRHARWKNLVDVIADISSVHPRLMVVWYEIPYGSLYMDPYEMHSNAQELMASLLLCYFCSLLHTSF